MDEDDIALADSFINFDIAAASPTADDPPDPSITRFSSSVPVPPVVGSIIESFGLVGSKVNEDESGGIEGEIIADDDDDDDDDDDAIGLESEGGEVSGEFMAIDDDDAVGMESEDGEIRDDVIADVDEIRCKIVDNDDVNATVSEGSKSESESSSSVSEIQEKSELEEGEIVETDIDENSEDEESKGRSVRFENLPLVPPVNVELGPHLIMLPVGVVTSIVGDKVIVEGAAKHDPLNAHSILWITERETPLGFIDETFVPVKNPYYVVRYNSEKEIPEGVHEGTSISFVAEFANYVLCKELYKKGSDASGMFDEEVSNESEFSDDEKEAKYKKIQKQAERDQNSQSSDSRKNDRQQVPLKDGYIPTMHVAPAAPMVAHGHGPPLMSSGQGFSGVGAGHSFSLLPQQALPQQSAMSHQQSMQGIPFQQQFNPSHRFPPPTVYPGGQPNMYAEPMHAQGPMNQNQWLPFPQFQAPTNFQSVNVSGNLGGPLHQFNPPAYFHSPPVPGILGAPPHQFNPPANFHSPPISGNQGGSLHQFNPPANFHSPPISGNQSGSLHQFNPPANFHSPSISGNQGGSLHQFNPPANFQSLHTSGNQGGPLHQFNPPAYFHSPQISGNQAGPPQQFNPPGIFQSPLTLANQQPSQFHLFNPGAYAGRERTFAGQGRRPSHRGGKGWQPAR